MTDPARAALWQFVSETTDDWLFGDKPELGVEQPYEPDAFFVRASVAPEHSGDIPPTVVDWPSELGVRLADAGDCVAAPAADVAALFADARSSRSSSTKA